MALAQAGVLALAIFLLPWIVYFAFFFMAPAYPPGAGRVVCGSSSLSIALDGASLVACDDEEIRIKATVPTPRIRIRPLTKRAVSRAVRLRVENVNPATISLRGMPTRVLESGGTHVVVECALEQEAELIFEWKKKDAAFLVWGDPRNCSWIGDGPSYFVFPRLLERVVREPADFAILVGDIVNAGREFEFRRFLRQNASIPFPVYVVPGNHELSDHQKDNSVYRKYFGDQTYRSFDLDATRFILLDTSSGKVDEVQLAWLTDALGGATGKEVIVIQHHPLWGPPTIPHYVLPESKARLAIERALSQAPHPWLLAGHIHGYYDLPRGNIREIITAGGAVRLSEKNNFHHYLRFHADGADIGYSIEKVPSREYLQHRLYLTGLVLSFLATWGIVFRAMSVRKKGKSQ